MYIESVPNRNSPPCILLRESYRQDGKVKKRTLANLTDWPPHLVEGLQQLLRGARAIESLEESFDVVRSLPHGHVAAVLGTACNIGLDRIIGGRGSRNHALSMAMVVARIIDPRSKLATARSLGSETQFSTLGESLGVEHADEDDLYGAMDWLLARQERIEKRLASLHLEEGSLVLYDVTSTYFEGRRCPLARLGHNRDGKRGKLQLVFGLLCNSEGCPVAVEVFPGDTGDPSTLKEQIQKIRKRFSLKRVVLVGDRGMLTEARLREEVRPIEGLDWMTALRASRIKKLAEEGVLQLSLFDQRDLAELTHPAYPGERLVVCRNPLLAEERSRKRRDLLEGTRKELQKIVDAARRPSRGLKGKAKIALRVGRVLNKFKMAKHVRLTIEENAFSFEFKERSIAREEALDGVYVIRTSLKAESMNSEGVVHSYKQLSVVERAFRSFKSIDLKVRPIHHHLEPRVRAHVFLCMLAYYVEWHMRKALASILFDDDDPQGAQARRSSVVSPSKRSLAAERKARTKKTPHNLPVHSFQTLLMDLGTICKSRIKPRMAGVPSFDKITLPTSLQERALNLLGVSL